MFSWPWMACDWCLQTPPIWGERVGWFSTFRGFVCISTTVAWGFGIRLDRTDGRTVSLKHGEHLYQISCMITIWFFSTCGGSRHRSLRRDDSSWRQMMLCSRFRTQLGWKHILLPVWDISVIFFNKNRGSDRWSVPSSPIVFAEYPTAVGSYKTLINAILFFLNKSLNNFYVLLKSLAMDSCICIQSHMGYIIRLFLWMRHRKLWDNTNVKDDLANSR